MNDLEEFRRNKPLTEELNTVQRELDKVKRQRDSLEEGS
jgi:hypothetical protein